MIYIQIQQYLDIYGYLRNLSSTKTLIIEYDKI